MIHFDLLMHFSIKTNQNFSEVSGCCFALRARTLAVFVNRDVREGLAKVVSIPSFWLLVTPAALLGDLAL